MNNQYTHRYTITAADMNKNYRLTPDAVLLFIQDCWARFMSCQHLAAFDIVREQKMWVITEFYAQFEPADTCWSEEVDVTVWNSELTPLRLYADFRITRADNGQLITTGYTCWNLLNTQTKHIERVDELSSRIALCEALALCEHKKQRFPAGGQTLKEVTHRVNRLDLDFNGHVNNRSYLSIAMLTATDEFLNQFMPQYMAIHWMRESYMDDVLCCHLQRVADEQTYYLHTLTKTDGTMVAQIFSRWQPAPAGDIVVSLQRH